jgi:hypothetical protein
MKAHLTELAARRTQLQLKAAMQRQQLGEAMHSFDVQIHGIDRGLQKVTTFVKKPLVLAGGAALLWFFGPRRALALVSKAAFFLPLARKVMGIFR